MHHRTRRPPPVRIPDDDLVTAWDPKRGVFIPRFSNDNAAPAGKRRWLGFDAGDWIAIVAACVLLVAINLTIRWLGGA